MPHKSHCWRSTLVQSMFKWRHQRKIELCSVRSTVTEHIEVTKYVYHKNIAILVPSMCRYLPVFKSYATDLFWSVLNKLWHQHQSSVFRDMVDLLFPSVRRVHYGRAHVQGRRIVLDILKLSALRAALPSWQIDNSLFTWIWHVHT